MFVVLARGRFETHTPMFPRKYQSPDLGLEPEEGTPLLHKGDVTRTEKPLPITQIVILLILSLSDPITSLSIRPYINQVRSSITIVHSIGNVCLSLSVSCQSLVVTK